MIKDLVQYLRAQNNAKVFIQTHNFPDHDSVASAFGLQYILKTQGINATLVYDGIIQRNSLIRMIDSLGISISSIKTQNIAPEDFLILVDGCRGNNNVTEILGKEIAVIDHHTVQAPESIPFVDIRPNYGACSTIIYTYFYEFYMHVPKEIATALMIGINVDTFSLSRGVHPLDIEAFYNLYYRSNLHAYTHILRNNIQTEDLAYYQTTLKNLKIINNLAFCWYPNGCPQNLLGILADFLISIENVEFAALCAHNNTRVNISFRSENSRWNAAAIAQSLVAGRGSGGGHAQMAGGVFFDAKSFVVDEFLEQLQNILKTI